MPRQGQAAYLGRTAVQDVKQHPLARLYAHRLPVAQHAPIDSEIAIAHFIAVRRALCEGGFHRGLAGHFKSFHSRGGSQKILGHVAALTEGRLEFLEDEENFSVIGSRRVLRLYVNWPNLALYCPA